MTLVLTTETNPGTSEWTDASILGSWVQFDVPPDGGTLDTLGKSGSLVATGPFGLDQTRNVAAPTVLGQYLSLSSRLIKNSYFVFSNPFDNAGNTTINLAEGAADGNYCLLVATYVSFSNAAPSLVWRLIVADGATLS